MASPTLSCHVPWFPCSSVSESVGVSHRHCPEAVKTTQHVPIPSLKSLRKRILCESGLARVSVRKESTKRGKCSKRAFLFSVPKKHVPGEATAKLGLQPSGPRKGSFLSYTIKAARSQFLNEALDFSLRYPNDRKAAKSAFARPLAASSRSTLLSKPSKEPSRCRAVPARPLQGV